MKIKIDKLTLSEKMQLMNQLAKELPKHEVKGGFMPNTKKHDTSSEFVVWRTIRSWHSNTYAGEGLFKAPNTNDGSGCLMESKEKSPLSMCMKPFTVTHRQYWHRWNKSLKVSAFLSYPNGMGCNDQYFWEALTNDANRYWSEQEMENAITKFLNRQFIAKFFRWTIHINKFFHSIYNFVKIQLSKRR